jgi:hypothetical protein
MYAITPGGLGFSSQLCKPFFRSTKRSASWSLDVRPYLLAETRQYWHQQGVFAKSCSMSDHRSGVAGTVVMES